MFPEQKTNWDWVRESRELLNGHDVLNLFGYTGAMSLALADCGALVTHVDSAKNIVKRARANAQRSGLQDAPIRWIVDDARKYVQREIKRERRYRAIYLDPPTFGHGANGEVWKIDRDLPELIEDSTGLLEQNFFDFLLTCHSPGYNQRRLEEVCQPVIDLGKGIFTSKTSGELCLTDRNQRKLNCGYFVSVSCRIH